jgi:hypothetical protein
MIGGKHELRMLRAEEKEGQEKEEIIYLRP